MSDDTPARDGLNRDQMRALLLVGLLLGGAIAAVAALNQDQGYTADGATYGIDGGPEVKITGNTTVENGGFTNGSNTVQLNTTDGNFTVTASGNSHIEIQPSNILGTRTKIENVDADNRTKVNPEDKSPISVESSLNSLTVEWESPSVDSDAAVAKLSNPSTGTANVTFYDLPADTHIAAVDGNGYLHDGNMTTSGGVGTFQIDLRSSTGATESIQLVSSDGAPQVFNPSPSDGEVLSDGSSVELSYDVDDPNFDEGANLSVTVDLNGNQIHSETVSTPSTISTTTNNAVSGTNNWTVTATNDLEQTTTKKWQFGTPENLSVYNESAPDQLINDREVTLKFYTGGDNVITRNTTHGNVSLSGLPTEEELVLTAEANSYIQRSITIKDISQQQRVYMINESVTTNQVRFVLNDQTGTFNEQSSTLYIRKALTVNGETKFRTVAADEFGVEGFTTDLVSGDRYRLVVENEDGDTRMLGTYRTTVDETVELQIGDLEYQFGDGDDDYSWDARFFDVNPDDDTTDNVVKFNYNDPTDSTSEISVRIHQQGNKSNELMNTTYSGQYGSFSVQEAIPDGEEGKNWVVDWEATRNGETISGKRVVGSSQHPMGIPLDKTWRIILSIGTILIVAGLFSQINAVAGSATISALGGVFWIIGWLPTEVGGGVIVASLVVSGLIAAGRVRGGV